MSGTETGLETESYVHFEKRTIRVKELCALVDESLLKLSVVDLVDVATCLRVREGRLKDQQGKSKSKLVIT